MTLTVHTPSGPVAGEIVARAPFCVCAKYPGSARPQGDWFCAATGVRRGETSVRISLEQPDPHAEEGQEEPSTPEMQAKPSIARQCAHPRQP